MHRLFCVTGLTLSLFIAGCGQNNNPAPGGNGAAGNGGDGGGGGAAPAGGGNNAGGGGNGQVSANIGSYSSAVQDTARILGGMSSEYEALASSGAFSINIEKTPKLYEELEGVMTRANSLPVPTLADAKQLKNGTLPQLVNAIKAAELAETHLHQKYNVFGFGRGAEIGNGISRAKGMLGRFQQNLPAAEKLTVGVPPTVGGPPPANTSFGSITDIGFDPASYRPAGGRTKEIIPWQVVADPPAGDVSLPPDAKLDVEIPHAEVGGSMFKKPLHVLYPAMPSTHVAVGLNQVPAQSRHVWDLKERKRLGTIKGLQLKDSKWLALSPDGKYFAGRPDGTNVIGIWDVDAKKAIKTVTLPVPDEPSLLEFGAGNRILVVIRETLYVIGTPDGNLEHQVDLSRAVPTSPFYVGNAWAISPGGKYLAIPNAGDKDVLFVDVTTGKKAGRLDVTTEFFAGWISIDFSNDGQRFAVVIDGSFGSWIQTWEIEKSRNTSTYKFDQALNKMVVGERAYQGPAVDWFPDNKRLLINGRGVFNTEAGEMEKNLPATTVYRLLPLSSDKLVYVEKTELAPYDLASVNTVAAKASKEANQAEPIPVLGAKKVPDLTEVDRSQIVIRESAGPAGWNIPPDPASPATIGDVKLDGFTNKKTIVHAAIADSGKRAVVGFSSDRVSMFGGNIHSADGMTTWVEYAPLAGGAAPQKYEFPLPAGLQAISPSGDLICTKSLKELGRLDVWNLTTQQHVAGFTPYDNGSVSAGGAVVWADFIDDQKLLTLAAGRLTLWQLPECRALWELTVNTKVRPALSPGRKYVALATSGDSAQECLVANTADGQPVARAAVPPKTGDATAIAFEPNGNRIALVTQDGVTGHVSIIDGTNGQLQSTFPTPMSGSIVQWADANHVLISGAYLINLPNKAPAWLYKLPGGIHLADSPDGRHWYCFSGQSNNEQTTLLAEQFPDAAAAAALGGGSLNPDIVLQPGGSIGFDINVGSTMPPGESDFAQKVATHFKDEFQAAGVNIDSTSPVKLVVRGSTGKTGRALSNDTDEIEVVWTVSVQKGGDVLWRQTRRVTNSGIVLVDRGLSQAEQEQQANQKRTEQMWKNASRNLLAFTPPTYVFAAGSGEGLGSSQLTANGAVK